MTPRVAVLAALALAAAPVAARGLVSETTMTDNIKLRASRPRPPVVPPVFLDGVRYAQEAGGVLAAHDEAGRPLWRLQVYRNVRHPGLEGDVQEAWFRSLRVERGRLVIDNERGERFEVDPATRQVVGPPAPASGVDRE